MVDVKKKPMNGHSLSSPVRGFVGQAAEVTSDVIELAELQLQLARADASNAMQLAVRPLIGGIIGVMLMLSAFPVLLFAIAGFMAKLFKISLESSQLIVGLTGFLIAFSILFISMRNFTTQRPFTRSAEEFKHNVAWLKTIFRSSNQ